MSEDDPRITVAPTPAATVPDQNTAAEPETEEVEGDAVAETEQDGDQGDADQPKEGDDGPSPDTVRRREQRQRAEERLRADNARLRAALQSRKSVAPDVNGEVERIIGKPPKEEDYRGDYLAFNTALTAYELDRRQTSREVSKRLQSEEARHASVDQSLRADQLAEMAEDHRERVKDFRAKTPDFDAVILAADQRGEQVKDHVHELVLESDHSAHLAYYLARNPKVLHDLNDMTERQAARTIGSIESRLSLPNPRTQTRAPAPFRPITGGAAPSSPDRDVDAYITRRYGKRR